MNDTFYDGHDELYHHAKFGEDRTMRAGCRCVNVVFFCLSRFDSGAPCVRGVHSSNKIALPFIVRFRRGLQFFFRRDCSFRCTTYFSFSSLGGATIIAKLRSKIAKIQKNRRKSLCAPLRIDSWGIWKKSTAVV